MTLVVGAVLGGYEKIARLLIQHKANVNARDVDGFTMLDHALAGDRPSMAELLRAHGARTSGKGVPLYFSDE